jgi:hypothetical protein
MDQTSRGRPCGRKTKVVGLLRLQKPTIVYHVLMGEIAKRPNDEFSNSKTEVVAPYGDVRHTRKGVIGSRVMSGRPSRRAQRSIRPDVSRAVIVVFDPLDIVLTEIAAGLHFDEFKIDL